MTDKPFAWIDLATDEVIEPGHPDHQFWQETFEFEAQVSRWESDGETFERKEKPTGARLPSTPQPPTVPQYAYALSREQAAASLGVGLDWFDAHVKPNIRVISKGRRVLIPVTEIERYVNEQAGRALRNG